MKYVIAWTYRLNGSAAENDQSLRRGLVLFSKWTTPSSTTYHQFVGRADGGGGFAVIETDNPSDLTDATGKFGTSSTIRSTPSSISTSPPNPWRKARNSETRSNRQTAEVTGR